MYDRTYTQEIASRHGEDVTVSGSIHRIRDLGGITFILLRDRTGTVQIVYQSPPSLHLESVVRVRGTVCESPKAPGGFELHEQETTVLSTPEGELPLPVNGSLDGVGIDTLLDNRLLTLRNPKIRHIFELQSTIVAAFAAWLRENDFTEIKSSKLIGSGTEGGTGLFSVDYFDTTVYLAQSPQFYKQAMVASGLERVFEIGAAYRAEKHDTARHLNEYISLDVEMAFIENEEDLMDLEVALLGAIFTEVEHRHEAILREYNSSVPSQEDLARIPRITHEEAKTRIKELTGKSAFEITPEGERTLCRWAGEEHGYRGALRNCISAQEASLLHLPERAEDTQL